MKKAVSLLLALILAILTVGQTVLPAQAVQDGNSLPQGSYVGSCGEELTWQYFPAEKKLSIAGRGEMDDFNESTIPWLRFCAEIETVSFPDRISSIGSYAFYQCTALRAVTIPEGVTEIRACAFRGCSTLKRVKLPVSLTVLGPECFLSCSLLQTVELPKKLTFIGLRAFAQCPSLATVVVRNPKCTLFSELENLVSGEWQIRTLEGQLSRAAVLAKHDASLLQRPAQEVSVGSDQRYVFRYAEDYAVRYGLDFVPLYVFSDVPAGKYYEIPVAMAAYTGITGGTGHGKFSPNRTCTREQVMTFLWAAAGKPEPTIADCPFTDADPDKYYYKAVLWAIEHKYSSGLTATSFGVGKPCTRSQVMTFLWKYAGSPEPKTTANPFTDVKKGKYYYNAILWAHENGITSGLSATKFGVNTTCTRGQVMTFFYGLRLWSNS